MDYEQRIQSVLNYFETHVSILPRKPRPARFFIMDEKLFDAE